MVHKVSNLKRMLVTFALMLLALSVALAGCSNSNSGNTDNTSGARDTNSMDLSNDEPPTVITIGMMSLPNVEDFKTNYYTKVIEEEMNVSLEFIDFPSNADEAKTKLALMVSSGQKLPDIINFSLDDATAYEYASKGIFVKLDDYFNDPELAVHFNAIPEEEREFLFNNSKLSDGSVYHMPNFVQADWNEGPYRAWINREWLEKVDMEIPETTDDLYHLLKAFVENDPNENGRQDEIGIVGSASGWAQQPMAYLMNSFLYANPDKNYLDVKNGEIIASFVQPEWKQGLEFMNKLVKDGLLSPLSFTQDQTQMRALINVEGGMAGIVTAGSYANFDQNVLGLAMDLLPPVKGPDGHSSTPNNPTLPNAFWYITKDNSNPELSFKIGDFMLSDEMSKISRYGEKGVEWTDDPAITAEYMGDFEQSHGIKTELAILDPSFWGNPQNKNWQNTNPLYLPGSRSQTLSAIKKADVTDGPSTNFNPKFFEHYVPNFPNEVITKLSYTADELRDIANSKTAIDAYVVDTAIAFIVGNRPFSDWDNYLNELNRMGLDNYLATAQNAFDRTK